MTGKLQRGSIVLRAGRYGVVWDVRGAELVLHPIEKPARRKDAHDVTLSLSELIGAGIEMPAAVIRCGFPVEVPIDGQATVGALAGQVVCRVVIEAIRAFTDAEVDQRWAAEKRHRDEARSTRPVKLVG